MVIVKRGIENVRKESLERNDERYNILADLETIKMHKNYRQKYIKNDGQKFRHDFTPADPNAWKYSPAKRSFIRRFFHFKNKCFNCSWGEHNRDSSGALHVVTNSTFQTNIESPLTVLTLIL